MIGITLDSGKDGVRVHAKLKRMQAQIKNTEPAMQRIAIDMMRVTGNQIKSRGRRGGGSWQNLKPETQMKKGNNQLLVTQGSRPGYSKIGKSYENKNTLFNSLVFRGAPFQILDIRNRTIEYGTTRPGANVHQKGYDIKDIPARPFLKFTDGDYRKWADIIGKHATRPFNQFTLDVPQRGYFGEYSQVMAVSSPISVFLNILVASQIEAAAINTLHKWFPTYLREVERQLNLERNTLRNPHNYTNRNSFDSLPGEELPKVVVIAPGTEGDPTKQGNQQYRALWRLNVGVATSAKDEVEANMLVKCYGAATRAIIMQKQKLGDDELAIAEIHWTGETYDDLQIPDQISIHKAAQLNFIVDIDDVVTRFAGPSEPTEQPDYYGVAEKVFVNLNKIPIEGEV